MKKATPRQSARTTKSPLDSLARRLGIAAVLAAVVAFQVSSCSFESAKVAPAAHALPDATQAPQSQQALRQTQFKACPQFFAKGIAPAVPAGAGQRELCYEAFAILHSGQTRTPVFVAEKLNRQSILDADEKRGDKFFGDARLPRAERAELTDYKGSGYARGHMAPAGDMPTPAAMAQSFSLANMVPQSSKQNSGPWAKIEKDTRHYAARATGDVFVITGPVFEPGSPAIGANKVRVPSYLYKLVYDAQTGRAWAHWQANADSTKASKPISYGDLVKRTGIKFLPVAPEDD